MLLCSSYVVFYNQCDQNANANRAFKIFIDDDNDDDGEVDDDADDVSNQRQMFAGNVAHTCAKNNKSVLGRGGGNFCDRDHRSINPLIFMAI